MCILKWFSFVSFRLPKTRSYDDLPTACDLTVPCVNRRSSDPSLNEKWQEHRRSLELNGLANPAEEGQEGERLPLGAQLSMAAGVGEGQMENILQEASKEEGGGEEQAGKLVNGEVEAYTETSEKTQEEPENAEKGGPYLNGDTEKGDMDGEEEHVSLMPGRLCVETDYPEHGTDKSEQPVKEVCDNQVCEAEETHSQTAEESSSEPEENEKCDENGSNDELQSSPANDSPNNLQSHLVLDGSTETLTDDHSPSWSSKLDHVTAANELSQKPEQVSEEGIVLMGLCGLQSQNERTCSPFPLIHSAFPPSECNAQTVCNRDQSSSPILDGPCLSADNRRGKQTLSRQNSCSNNPQIHLRNIPHKCPLHSCGRHRIGSTSEQSARNHLDDDGMPLYVDAIQQRLRQMESGHQQEVETLKKQVQELRCRLENRLHSSSLRFNGEYSDEVVSCDDLIRFGYRSIKCGVTVTMMGSV